ncbi:MAG: hypothetical protein AAFR40_16665 [Pseudomonadota bacterium]
MAEALGREMLKTIMLSGYIAVQGELVKVLNNGRMIVRVGKRMYEGVPV